jgi:hypothetical protein
MSKPESLEVVMPAEGSPKELAPLGSELTISENNAADLWYFLHRADLIIGILRSQAGKELLPIHRERLIELVEGDIDNAFEIVKKEDDRGCRIANAEYLRLHPELAV